MPIRTYFKQPGSSPQLYPTQRNPWPHQRCQAATQPPPSPGAASGSAHSSHLPPPTVVSAPAYQTTRHLASETNEPLRRYSGNEKWHPGGIGARYLCGVPAVGSAGEGGDGVAHLAPFEEAQAAVGRRERGGGGEGADADAEAEQATRMGSDGGDRRGEER